MNEQSLSSTVTDDRILQEFNDVSQDVDPKFARFVMEQVAYNLDVEESRVVEIIVVCMEKERIWRVVNNTMGAVWKYFKDPEFGAAAVKPYVAFVYVFKCGKLFKIGVSSNPKQRLSALNRGIPPNGDKVLPFLEFYIKDPYKVEKVFHEHFKNKQVRTETGGIEWFRLSVSDLEWIKTFVGGWNGTIR